MNKMLRFVIGKTGRYLFRGPSRFPRGSLLLAPAECLVFLSLLLPVPFAYAYDGTQPSPVEGPRGIAAPTRAPSVVKAKDGRILMIGQGKIAYSTNSGQTWTKPETLPVNIDYAIRLASGVLGGPGGAFFYVSKDEGKTWDRRGRIYVGKVPATPYDNTMIQMKSGRLLLPVRFYDGNAHSGLMDRSYGKGYLNGKMVIVEGHAHFPEPDIAYVYYSDDEGRTWRRSEGGVIIWRQQGYGGMWPCDEPSVIETSEGSVLMFCRTTLGRLFLSRSDTVEYRDREGRLVTARAGQRFGYPEPTTLASSYSPCAVRALPETNDILIIWNQVSSEEIRAGYRRGRLCSAVSKDGGKTWQHFRTIDAMVLPPVGRIEPDPEPQMVRSLDYVGILPHDFGTVDYPTFDVVDGKVFVFWGRQIANPDLSPSQVRGRRLRVLPLEFFYEEQKPEPGPQPRLLLRVQNDDGTGYSVHPLPSRYFESRFYCSSRHLNGYLKSPIGSMDRDVYAPLEQVISLLGWKLVQYDDSGLSDPLDPRVIVTVGHPHAEASREKVR